MQDAVEGIKDVGCILPIVKVNVGCKVLSASLCKGGVSPWADGGLTVLNETFASLRKGGSNEVAGGLT